MKLKNEWPEFKKGVNEMCSNISDEQAAEYLELYTTLVQTVYKMKKLEYSKTELKKIVDSVYKCK